MSGAWKDRSGTPLEPKPFGKVGLSGSVTRRRIARTVAERTASAEEFVPGHDRYKNSLTGRLDCSLRVLTPLHVGSGVYDADSAGILRGIIRTSGEPAIPGTSLKGCIRSVAEAISCSCVRITRKQIERFLSAQPVAACRNIRAGGDGTLCTCCSLFGALGYRGRISFGEARSVGESTSVHRIQSPYPPRDFARAYKNPRGQYDGRKFYYHGKTVVVKTGEPYEVVKPGSEFRFAMHFESLTEDELCVLMVSMGISDDLVIKMGGGKQAMLGAVEIFPELLELRDAVRSFEDFGAGVTSLTGDELRTFIDRIGGEHSALIDEDALDEVMRIWDRNSNRKAPEGMY